MRVLHALALYASLASACTDPPAIRRMTVRVAVADSFDGITGWRPAQRELIAGVLPELDATGNTWVYTSSVDEADVVVRTFDSGPGCRRGAGRYTVGTRYVEIDYACTPSPDTLRYVVAHELLHWLTDRVGATYHICRTHSEVLTDRTCYPGIIGEAVLNPVVPEANDRTFEELGAIPSPRPTRLDLQLLDALGVP